ncbi:MAG: hypothetical protein D6B25_05800 [Desulfobulbaceae bacterium]|nr:MAG: hypothetical protein D6B25_05800 [Desulfobulbaceae bacterium]
MPLLCLGFILQLFFVVGVSGAEVDSITVRSVELENAINELNYLINKRIRAGVVNANDRQNDFKRLESDQFCDEEILYDELRKSLFQSLTASFGLKGYSLDVQLRELLTAKSYNLPLRDSIYRDIDYIEGFSLNLKELTHVVNLDGQLVGLDKIGHFFAEGWEYFELTRFKDQPLLSAMQWGIAQEEGTFGLATTGIFSYGDLVANFNGWRFWNRVRKYHPDPLQNAVSRFFSIPYVKCATRIKDSFMYKKRVKEWRIGIPFDLRNYLDSAWDEGNNCSSYKDPIIEDKVMRRISAIDPEHSCPAEPSACRESREKYGAFARYLLHPNCLTAE